MTGFSYMEPMQYSSSVPAGSRQLNNRSSSGALLANGSAEAPTYDETFIGRKVWTRWPDDNNFYKAVIRNYDPVKACLSRKKLLQAFLNHFGNNIFLCLFLQDKHVLVYDANTSRETWECVDIKEVCLSIAFFFVPKYFSESFGLLGSMG